MGGETCLNCESIFAKNQFTVTCNCCCQSFLNLQDFRSHFVDIFNSKRVCSQNEKLEQNENKFQDHPEAEEVFDQDFDLDNETLDDQSDGKNSMHHATVL